MPSPPFEDLEVSVRGGRKPVDMNVMKRNMSIAKGFLDISLLSANANQLRNALVYGNKESNLHYMILSGIIISLILQVSAGVALVVGERFDINKEEEQERGNTMNTVVTCLIFLVLIINVFVASLGVDLIDPAHPYPDPSIPYPPGKVPYYPTDSKDMF